MMFCRNKVLFSFPSKVVGIRMDDSRLLVFCEEISP